VRHVELTEPEESMPPPVDTNTSNDLADAKSRINYSALAAYTGLNSESIALFDTGVRAYHSALVSGVNWGAYLDCVNGGTQCNLTGNANYSADDAYNTNRAGHGTASAHILVGNSALGVDHSGLLHSRFGSMRVYNDGANGGLNTTAARNAFDVAIASGFDVMVAEMQLSSTSTNTSIAAAAARAFDSGAVVVAADGNLAQACSGSGSQVAGPASAKKVLGIGGFDINSSTGAPVSTNCYGPTPDGRNKPELLFPTNTEAASTTSTTSSSSFSGTSGATPFAGATAMMIRNFYVANGWDASPANIYAAMLANGTGSGSGMGPISASEGAGPFKFRPTACSRWYNGWRSVGNGQAATFTFNIYDVGAQEISMAIYWAEGDTYHNKINLALTKQKSPSETVTWNSQNPSNVWQRIVIGNPQSGSWTATIRGANVVQGPQKVYLLLHTRVPCN
jgi:hypothetical protein